MSGFVSIEFNQLTRDIVAGFIVAGGVTAMMIFLRLYLSSRVQLRYRWIFAFCSLAGFGFAFMFSLSLLRLYSKSDIVDPVVGRPVIIIGVTALVLLGLLVDNLYRGNNRDN